MDMPEYPEGRSPRRGLQGPRPTTLKVHKESHKIRKPPVVPPQQPQAPPRPPVIIYTVSPKIIHANPNEFMSLVQRLTGPNSTASSSSSVFQDNLNNGAISPAARFASIEKTKTPEGRRYLPQFHHEMENMVEGVNISREIESSGRQFQGILSPNPASLPSIPPKYFSPSSDHQNPLNFFYDLSPVLHSNKNYLESSLLPSPSTFVSPYLPSPNTLDLFRSLFDL